jgi:hypothetical protein
MLGVMVYSTIFNEKNMLIFDALNAAVKENIEASLLYHNLSTHVSDNDFAIMSISEINNFYGGALIATCPITADTLVKCSVNAKKVYYLWDLSFLLKHYNFNATYDILNNCSLIVRSLEHQKIIRNIFNLDSEIMSNFDLEKMWNLQPSTKLD